MYIIRQAKLWLPSKRLIDDDHRLQDLQPLTAGARTVNSENYLVGKMDVGYGGAMRVMDELLGSPPTA